MTDLGDLQERVDKTIETIGEIYKAFPGSATKMSLETIIDVLMAGIY